MNSGAVRKNLRFNADENAVVWISKDQANFSQDIIGLLDSESFSGFSMVVLRDRGLKDGDTILIKVGHFSPTQAIIRWTKEVEKDLFKFGLEYTDL